MSSINVQMELLQDLAQETTLSIHAVSCHHEHHGSKAKENEWFYSSTVMQVIVATKEHTEKK